MQSTGLFDLQVNGFAGIDFNSEAIDSDQLDHALDAMLATGVTWCLPTIITASAERLVARFAALDRALAGSRLGPLMVPGYHLEGPFLNPAEGYAGCHPPADMTPPDGALVERLASSLSRPILLVTVAPELPGSDGFIRAMTAAGRVVAIGHSAADAQTVARAAEAGARLSTHLGNGLPQTMHKVENTLFAQLAEDRLCASFIADGIHLPLPALKSMLRAKGTERSILVTDAVSAAASSLGLHPFAGMSVEHAPDGSVRLPGTRYLAGSALTLDKAVRNIVAWGFATPDQALRMASETPRLLMAPALAAFSVELDPGYVDWTPEFHACEVRAGSIRRTYSGRSP